MNIVKSVNSDGSPDFVRDEVAVIQGGEKVEHIENSVEEPQNAREEDDATSIIHIAAKREEPDEALKVQEIKANSKKNAIQVLTRIKGTNQSEISKIEEILADLPELL